jgi:hypothetical protein
MKSFLPYMFPHLVALISRLTNILKEMLYVSCYYNVIEGTGVRCE